METTETPGSAAAVWIAATMSVPKFWVVASTRSMLASGAITWAHSTSSDSSGIQPALAAGSVVVLPVVPSYFVKLMLLFRPKNWSNWKRSPAATTPAELSIMLGSS